MPLDRRQFERLVISGEAIAVDEHGERLGRVSHAGGGGMTITLEPQNSQTFVIGSRLRVVVDEPSTGIQHTVSVEVKYLQGRDLGVQFIRAL